MGNDNGQSTNITITTMMMISNFPDTVCPTNIISMLHEYYQDKEFHNEQRNRMKDRINSVRTLQLMFR